MKTLLSIFVALFVSALSVSTASAAGGVPSNYNNLYSSIDLPGFQFGYSTSAGEGKVNFSANMSNSDRLSGVSISMTRDPRDPTHGCINADFSGIVGNKPIAMDCLSQSANINRRGVEYSSYSSLSAYQEVSWPTEKDGSPIYGDWVSTGSASMTLFGVTPTWASCNYDEYLDDWSGKTYFNGSVVWQLDFNSPSPMPMSIGFGTSVPEPATLSLLGIGAVLAIRRRARR